MSDTLLRVWCPVCNKQAGAVERDPDEGPVLVGADRARPGQRIAELTGRDDLVLDTWIDKPFRVTLAGRSSVPMHATCRRGHRLAIDLPELRAAVDAGQRRFIAARWTG